MWHDYIIQYIDFENSDALVNIASYDKEEFYGTLLLNGTWIDYKIGYTDETPIWVNLFHERHGPPTLFGYYDGGHVWVPYKLLYKDSQNDNSDVYIEKYNPDSIYGFKVNEYGGWEDRVIGYYSDQPTNTVFVDVHHPTSGPPTDTYQDGYQQDGFYFANHYEYFDKLTGKWNPLEERYVGPSEAGYFDQFNRWNAGNFNKDGKWVNYLWVQKTSTGEYLSIEGWTRDSPNDTGYFNEDGVWVVAPPKTPDCVG